MAEFSQFLRLENGEWVYLITSRTLHSRLWFVNNKALEEAILGYLAKCQKEYGATFYAFILMGNHYHLVASFPKRNRADFMRSFNSMLQALVKRHVSGFKGGQLHARRYSAEVLPNDEDVTHWSLYSWLNPVDAGLCKDSKMHLQYSSFEDTVLGIVREYPVFKKSDYTNRKRYNKKLTKADCTVYYPLVFSRLPEFEQLSAEDYEAALRKELAKRTKELCRQRKEEGKGFANQQKLKAEKPGSYPRRTKTSTRHSHRPLVLTLCAQTRRIWLDLYFKTVEAFWEASRRYRKGEEHVFFPPGTYRPPMLNI